MTVPEIPEMLKCPPLIQNLWNQISEVGVEASLEVEEVRVVKTLNRVGLITGLLVLPFFWPAVNPTSDTWGWVELVSFAGFVSVLFWHYLGWRRIAILVILFTAIFKIFFSASYRGHAAGEQLFFIPLIMGILLAYGSRKYRFDHLLMWGLTITAFTGLELTQYELLAPETPFEENKIREIFTINFAICGTVIIAITHHYFQLARKHQQQLVEGANRQSDLNHQLSLHIEAISHRNTQLQTKERDLTEAKEKAEAASRAKSEFLSVMSHELRTPLNAIIGSVELLADTPLSSEQNTYTETIRQGGENLYVILDNILKYSHGEKGTLTLSPRLASMDQILEYAVGPFQADAKRKGLDLTWKRKANAPDKLLVDDRRLTQVLRNLISNGIKFTKSGSVALCAYLENQDDQYFYCFSVSDSGVGIPAEFTDQIFEPFFQSNSFSKRTHDGAGLGLTVSQKLTQLMKGSITVVSEPGKGSEFIVKIPFTPPVEDQEDPSKPQKLRILIAEDNLLNQKVAVNMLRKIGYSAKVAANGAEALDLLREETFDLVFMDMQMPVMNGLEASQKIRSRPGTIPQPIIIAMTANVSHEDQDACRNAGMDDFLGKPIRKDTLKSMLDKWSHSPSLASN